MINKYIFFDFNGTVLNDVKLCHEILNEMLLKYNHQEVSLEEYKNIFTFPIIDYYRKAGFDFEKESFEELSKYFIKRYQKKSLSCSLYPHLKETLFLLLDLGYKVVLLSASNIDNLKEQTNEFGLTTYFNDILGIENIEAHSKKHIAEDYFKKHHIDPRHTLFIGDSTHDYEIASELGGRCLLVTYGHQSKEILKKCNVPLIDDISEVKKYLW